MAVYSWYNCRVVNDQNISVITQPIGTVRHLLKSLVIPIHDNGNRLGIQKNAYFFHVIPEIGRGVCGECTVDRLPQKSYTGG